MPALWQRPSRRSPSSRRAWIEINSFCRHAALSSVALLAEGVDRNSFASSKVPLFSVALLAEGVDRNCPQHDVLELCQRSPSSRRAWIEIIVVDVKHPQRLVALLAEGVDRNQSVGDSFRQNGGRPPRGGRG